jgi:hypothetical protein
MFDMVTGLVIQACWLGTMYIGCNMKICRTPLILNSLELITYVVFLREGLFDQRHWGMGGAQHPLGH